MDDCGGFREVYRLPKLESLLLGAKTRYQTARATVRLITDGELATAAVRRTVDHAAERGVLLSFGDPESGTPPHSVFYDSEEVVRLWHERPDRWREEACSSGDPVRYEVANGGRRWLYDPPEAVYTSNNYGARRGWPPLAPLLDPSRVLFDRLFDSATVRGTGRGLARAGRETVEVEAKTISPDYPPRGLFGEEGAEDYRLSVDAEVGVILRYAERLAGEEFYAAEVEEISFDEEFPEGTFQLDLPGVEFRDL